MYPTKFLCLLFVIYVKFDPSSAVKCHKYNETCGSEESCGDVEDCGKDHHCFALWQNGTNSTRGNIRTKLQGCFRLESGECSDRTSCVASIGSKNNLFFCCCEGDLCNEKYSWAPTPTTPLLPIPSIIKELETKETDYTTIAAICIVLPVSIGLFCFICLLLGKKQLSIIKKHFRLVPLLDPDRPRMIPRKRAKPRRIEFQENIVCNKYSKVRKAIDLETMQKVAVKIYEGQNPNFQAERIWKTEQEVYQLPTMKGHENILEFVAAERHAPTFWIITKYHDHGSLLDFLRANTITWDQLYKIAYSVTSGLVYLHEEIQSDRVDKYKPAIAHRDFKSSNIILKSDLTACISDFGLSIIFTPTTTGGDAHGQVGTTRYMAPEVLEGAINFSRDAFLRTDIYALGMVLWELLSRCSSLSEAASEYSLPFAEVKNLETRSEAAQEVIVNKRSRPIIKESWRKTRGVQLLCDTIEECWDHDAEARLSASCVIERLKRAHQLWPVI